jgi:hypothetical protein
MELTISKPKPSKCCMIRSFIASDLTNAINRTKRFISRDHVRYVARNEYKIPHSRNCVRALEMVQSCSPDFLVNHCLRSYAFGVAMAHKIDKSFDREVFFLGSIMHDLGLTKEFDGDDTFEIEGAKAAKTFCIDNDIDVKKSDLVHEMVALHNSVGIAHKKETEIALLHFGAGADVAGLWLHDINRRTLEEVISEYPRLDFKEGMTKLLSEQIERKPNSYMATMVELGFFKKLNKTPF